ncbi:ATP-binding protein [Amycolatopsis sp. CA-128772]|uniref:ATP-binding protein n=1 Tax=Amycolatopsis sp. CA-128772 TaxID=2073159 RepID=UPI000CCFD851|nr:ATP-binding protein [Amycolatopsis sp. CA-128772]
MTEHTAEELLRRLEQRQHEASARALAEFDARSLCLLSLLPEWTPTLAEQLELHGNRKLAEFVDKLAWADLVEHRSAAGGQLASFWIRARRRHEVGDYLRDKMGVEAVVGFYGDVCSRVARLDPPELRAWIRVREFHADPSGRELLSTIESMLHRQDLPAAATMVATSRVVCEVVGGPLEDAVKRAQWRLDREYRTRDDLGHLTGYHRRAEIEDALTALVTGADGPWALHLFGNAGVGKTMTVRYLASGKLAEDNGMPRFPVARVDFDHLDPRYPERRPAELLVALTDELLGFATTRDAEHRYRAVRDAADAVHEELSRSDPDPVTVAGLRLEAIDRFADFVGQLPSPVVLVLDTCEELAKLYPAGAEAPAIDQTFDLLHSLHRRNSDIRVVLAGRRRLVKPADGTLYSGPKLLTRDYVRVVPMSGFTHEDAAGYLEERNIPERLRPTLLARSADGTRYNPFELAGLCDWVRDEPGLDLAELSATVADPYVERRILSRIQDRDVIAALPVTVALGEFDRMLITPALTRLGVDVPAAFDGLAGQEWVNVRVVGGDGMPRVIEVDEHIRDRLRAVLERADRPPADLAALGRDAAEVILAQPLPKVTAATVIAAVRLLPPAEAATLWAKIDHEILFHGEWAWAMRVAPRVAATEEDRQGPTILAAVLATEASARIHSGYREGLHQLWDAVADSADRYPPGETRTRLGLRAALGKVAVAETVTESSSWVFRRFAASGIDAELEDAILAALENPAVWWSAVAGAEPILRELAGDARSPHIAAGAAVMLAGLAMDRRVEAPVADLLETHIRTLDDLPGPVVPEVRRDWVCPRGMPDRLRLVRVLVALYGGDPLDEEAQRALRHRGQPGEGDIDADRLLAALLDHRLARGVVDQLPAAAPVVFQAGDPVPWLHTWFGRPHAVAVADALTLLGRYREAAENLDEIRSAAIGSGDDAELVEACDLALLRVCRAARTTEHARVRTLAYDGSPRLRDEAWLVLRLLKEADDPRWAEYCSPYGRWRCHPRGQPPEAIEWPVDHLDLWEMAAFRVEFADGYLPRDGLLARGRSDFMAGEIHAVLGSWQAGRELLERAQERFAAAGYHRGVDQVRRLLKPTAARPEPVVPSRWRLFAARWRSHLTRQSLPGLRHIAWRSRAMHSWTSFFSWLCVGAVVGGVVAGVSALLGASVGWVIGLGAVPVVLAQLLPYWVGWIYDMRRLEVVPEGPKTLLLRLYPEQMPWNIRFRPKRSKERKRLATPLWTGTGSWSDDGSPEGLADVPRDDRLPRDQVSVTFLQVPRELQFTVRWERALAEGVPAARRPRTVYVRWLPGARGSISLEDWRARTEAFHGPLRLRPSRAWTDVPGACRLVHLVGTPVRTSAGWQFRVRDASGRAAREHSRGADRREELFDLHTLTRDPVGLLVLQADPTDVVPLPLGHDHDGFVGAASAAMDNGSDAVLVVPPLPDEVAKEAVQIVWRAVMRSRVLELQYLLDLTEDIKYLVHRAERGTTGTPMASIDVLLFVRAVNRGGS